MKLPERIETTDVRAYESRYTVLVNDEPLRTPKGHPVTVRSWELANALADDLMAEGSLALHTVTLYSLYATQRDFIEGRIEGTIGTILQHLPGDFALHPDADPVLAAKQLSAWAPLLEYLRDMGVEVPIQRIGVQAALPPQAKPMQEALLPWELTEGVRTQLLSMSPAQLSVVLHAVMSCGSVALGMLLARHAIALDRAVGALTTTASHSARDARGVGADQEVFEAEMRQIVRRMLQYGQLTSVDDGNGKRRDKDEDQVWSDQL